MEAKKDDRGSRLLVPTGKPSVVIECDDVLIAVGQENAFPWVESDAGVAFDRNGLPNMTRSPSSRACDRSSSAATPHSARRTSLPPSPTAMRPRSRSTHSAGQDPRLRPDPMTNLVARKWASTSGPTTMTSPSIGGSRCRRERGGAEEHWRRSRARLRSRPGGRGSGALSRLQHADRVPPVHRVRRLRRRLPIDCISFVPNAPEGELRHSLTAPRALNLSQAIYVSEPVKTRRVMVEDEDLCLHCGLCAKPYLPNRRLGYR